MKKRGHSRAAFLRAVRGLPGANEAGPVQRVRMRDLLGICDDAKGFADQTGFGRSVAGIGQGGIDFEALAQDDLGRKTVRCALAPAVVKDWPVSDTAGESLRACRLSHEAGQDGPSGPASGRVLDPGGEAAEVDRRGCQQVLQVRLGHADMATEAQAHRPYPARERALDVGSPLPVGCERRLSLRCPCRDERPVLRARAWRQQAALRARAARLQGAGFAVPRCEADVQNRAPEVVFRAPTPAAVPRRTDRHPPIPVEAEGLDGERAVGARLPPVVLVHRPGQVDNVMAHSRHETVGVDVGGADEMARRQ